MKTPTRYFLTTGTYSREEKQALQKQINSLGGILIESKVIIFLHVTIFFVFQVRLEVQAVHVRLSLLRSQQLVQA